VRDQIVDFVRRWPAKKFHEARGRKLEEARRQRQLRRQQAA
jgi:hypothetical protein